MIKSVCLSKKVSKEDVIYTFSKLLNRGSPSYFPYCEILYFIVFHQIIRGCVTGSY